MKLNCCAIFKNEETAIEEWINHYRREGVDEFVLINNGSTDNSPAIAEANGAIVYHDDAKHAQVALYNKYLLPHTKHSDWSIICDLDEFIYSRLGQASIKAYLKNLPDEISDIRIPWKLFGSNSHIQQPPSIINGFQMRAMYNKRNNGMTDERLCSIKSIVRGKFIERLGVHEHFPTFGRSITSDGRAAESCIRDFQPTSETILADSYLHLNHYAIQSLQWFETVKCARGDVNSVQDDSTRNQSYFNSFDYSDTHDSELANKVYFP